MRTIRKRQYFSLIEIVLAMGVLALGIVGIIGLLPTGLLASRDAIAESYAADSVDQLMKFMAARLKDPANSYQNWDTYGTSLPETRPGETEPATWVTWFESESTLIQVGGAQNQFYYVEQKAPASDTPDFSAVYRVWHQPVTYSSYDTATGTWTNEVVSTNTAIGINVEVSWPKIAPYRMRKKSLYYMEVFKAE